MASFRVSPPVSGAHAAVFHVDEAVSRDWDVFLFTSGIRKDTWSFPPRSGEIRINDHFREYSYASLGLIPLGYLTRQGSGIPQIYTGRYLAWRRPRMIEEWIDRCDVIQVEQPWPVGYIARMNRGRKPMVLVLYDIYADLFSGGNHSADMITTNTFIQREILRQEREAVEVADAVIVVTETDRERLLSAYTVSEAKVYSVPWGVNPLRYRPRSDQERDVAKAGLGLSGKRVILFSGSFYAPNVDAVREVLRIAGTFGNDVVFLIVGRVGEAFDGISLPNVRFSGFVSETDSWFAAADLAVNPMRSGGGMHLKVLEYLASGLPVVTTEVGARGLAQPWRDYLLVGEPKEFPDLIRELLREEDLRRHYRERGREVVEVRYSWEKIAEERIRIYESLKRVRK